jgi:hypothetical protein
MMEKIGFSLRDLILAGTPDIRNSVRENRVSVQ